MDLGWVTEKSVRSVTVLVILLTCASLVNTPDGLAFTLDEDTLKRETQLANPEDKITQYQSTQPGMFKTPYKTWSLFIVCNLSWLKGQNNQKLHKLYAEFIAFGEVIGRENLAVWFWTKSVPREKQGSVHSIKGDTIISAHVDITRSVDYCKRYNLVPSEGPHIVTTTTYPGDLSPDRNTVKISLNGRTSSQITEVLIALNDQIAAEKLDQKPFDEKYWLVWESIVNSVKNTVSAILEGSRITIDAKMKFVNVKYEWEGKGLR